MKARETKLGAPNTDLLVCFPSRGHLTLRPKPICSPAHHHNHHHQQKTRIKKITTRDGCGGGQASPILWARNKQMGSEILSEPTSPKVTCAGQIKVRHKSSAVKNWQSVMEEIERIHSRKRQKKRSSTSSKWMETLGFKKEVMQFLTCLRNIRLDFRCFGSFPRSDITTDNEVEDKEEEEENENYRRNNVGIEENSTSNNTLFSKWYMVLQENHQKDEPLSTNLSTKPEGEETSSNFVASIPPPNALLLMRCRSAPATKSWLQEELVNEVINKDHEEEEEAEEEESKINDKKEKTVRGKNLKCLMEEEKKNGEINGVKKENLVVMKYESEFYKISTDIAKETWVNVGGGMRSLDPFSRSHSWKR